MFAGFAVAEVDEDGKNSLMLAGEINTIQGSDNSDLSGSSTFFKVSFTLGFH